MQEINEMISIYDNNIDDIAKMNKRFLEVYSIEDCLQLLKHQTKIIEVAQKCFENTMKLN